MSSSLEPRTEIHIHKIIINVAFFPTSRRSSDKPHLTALGKHHRITHDISHDLTEIIRGNIRLESGTILAQEMLRLSNAKNGDIFGSTTAMP